MIDENYIPEIEDSYIKLVCKISVCSICKSKMLKITRKLSERLHYLYGNLFPLYWKLNLNSQLERANVEFSSRVKDTDNHYICEKCGEEGKSTFICSLCNKERKSDLKEDYFGDPPEYLCTVCYETVPAKKWKEKRNKLYEEHRYDFE